MPSENKPPMQPEAKSRTIARNSAWYGSEMAFWFLLALVSTIPMARVIGPERLGYYNYIFWLTSVSAALGSLGISATTRKYMAEYLGRREPGIVRAVFLATLRLQTGMAVLVTGVGLILVFAIGDPAYRAISAFLVASILPTLISYVPGSANNARESVGSNVLAAVAGGLVFGASVIVSLSVGWDLLGISVGVFAWKVLECVLKLASAWRWIGPLPAGEKIPASLRSRMFSFSSQNLILMALNVVVWNRSEVFFLKAFSALPEVTFYYLGYNLMEKAVALPQAFANSAGISVMAEHGKGEQAADRLASISVRYLTLLAFPTLIGLAALSSPLIRVMYGAQYIPTIAVLAISALLALPRVTMPAVESLMLAKESQSLMVRWGLVCAAFNILLDVLLIPAHGAIGAAVANGVAQATSVLGMWFLARRRFRLELPFGFVAKVALCSLLMGAVVVGVARVLPAWVALPLGTLAGCVVFFYGLRFTHCFEDEDRMRFGQLRRMLPEFTHRLFDAALAILMPLRPAGGASLAAAAMDAEADQLRRSR